MTVQHKLTNKRDIALRFSNLEELLRGEELLGLD